MELLGARVSHLYTTQRLTSVRAAVDQAYLWMNAYTSCNHLLVNEAMQYCKLIRETKDLEQLKALKEHVSDNLETMQSEACKLYDYEPLAFDALKALGYLRGEEEGLLEQARKLNKDTGQFKRAINIMAQLEGRLRGAVVVARTYRNLNERWQMELDVAFPPMPDLPKAYDPSEEEDE